MTTLAFDPDELREKYRAERDKRLRPDGNEQYVEVTGQFAHYLDDPYVEPIVREPLFDEVDVVVIGGGFGGLLAGARLKEAGIADVRIVEKGGDFGGTWYWNRYPGRDVRRRVVHLPAAARGDRLRPEGEVHQGAGDPRAQPGHRRALRPVRRRAVPDRGDGHALGRGTARWLVVDEPGRRAAGPLRVHGERPAAPSEAAGHPGHREASQGHSFHTSRWDYDYTGGDPDGNLDDLRGKRVGIIGTGATAVQCVPHLGAAAEQLYVFQRTPSSIDVRNNRPTDPEWAAGLEPGWQKRRMENFNKLVSGRLRARGPRQRRVDRHHRQAAACGCATPTQSDLARAASARTVELADFEKMEQVRARVDTIVNDPNTAEALKPYYRQFCKRPCFHDEYLDTYNRPNVTLVDTDGRGVDRITEQGVVVGETEYEIDCLIYATGFEVGTDYTRRAGCEIIGRDGLTLTEKWKDGASTLHGMHTRDFPNCFIFSRAVRVHGQLPARPRRAEQARRVHPASRLRPRRRHDRGVPGGRGRLGGRRSSSWPSSTSTSWSRARPATTTTRASRANGASATGSTAPARWPSSRSSPTGATKDRWPGSNRLTTADRGSPVCSRSAALLHDIDRGCGPVAP